MSSLLSGLTVGWSLAYLVALAAIGAGALVLVACLVLVVWDRWRLWRRMRR